jgi:hypothetical protein
MKGVRRRATVVSASVATAVALLIVASAMSRSEASSSLQIGVGKNATLEQLYAFLQVSAPVNGNWLPVQLPENCSMEWVVWPSQTHASGFCLGRWEAENSDMCRSVSICNGCELYNLCQQGRKAVDSCTNGDCTVLVYQKNVSQSQRPAEIENCRQQSISCARTPAQDGPYNYRWWVSSTSSHNFVCETQFMAAAKNMVRASGCGCERAKKCVCQTENLVSGVELTKAEGLAELDGQIDHTEPADVLEAHHCETLQDSLSESATERHDKLLVRLNAETDASSRTAFQYTIRLMHELDMFRPTAEEFMESALAVPPCGVVAWLTGPPVCTSQVPAASLSVSDNCVRLLSNHVASGTITEDVFRVCTDALRTISLNSYDDSAADCTGQIQNDVAQFATALLEKANN